MTGKRLSFKFENSTIDVGLYLLDFLCLATTLPRKENSKKINITGNRLSLKIQNSTVDETILFEDIIVYQTVLNR